MCCPATHISVMSCLVPMASEGRSGVSRSESVKVRLAPVPETLKTLPATYSLKRSGVGSGPDQMQLVSLDAVNQQPIGLDMKLPVTFPDPPQRMIAIACGQRVLPDQCRQRGVATWPGPCLAFALSSRRA